MSMSQPPEPQSPQTVAEAELPPSAESAAPTAVAVKSAPKRRVRTKAAGPRKSRPAPPPAGAHNHIIDDEKEGFFQRFGVFLGLGIVVLGGVAFFVFKKPSPSAPPVKQERIVMIAPLPPAPPPPPPPPPPPKVKPPEEKMEKETAPTEAPKEAPKPEPVKAPEPAPLGTNLKGDGPGMSGLGTGSGLGGGILGGSTGGNGGGSRFGAYAGQVQARIADALRKHPKTKNATLRIEVRIWPDATGRITRSALAGSTGDTRLDEAIQNGVLNGLQLHEPPPAGMKLPIVLRMTARRPN